MDPPPVHLNEGRLSLNGAEPKMIAAGLESEPGSGAEPKLLTNRFGQHQPPCFVDGDRGIFHTIYHQ
jgi:hypothetical protein